MQTVTSYHFTPKPRNAFHQIRTTHKNNNKLIKTNAKASTRKIGFVPEMITHSGGRTRRRHRRTQRKR